MNNGHNTEVAFKLEELYVPLLPFDGWGRLYSATPNKAKPNHMSGEEWTTSLLVAFFGITTASFPGHGRKFELVLQSSLWESIVKTQALQESFYERQQITKPISLLKVTDEFCGTENFNPETPIESIGKIFDALKSGIDIFVFSCSEKISGFIPAVLSRISDSQCHIVKLWHPIIIGQGYELTPFQLGYLYGLTDASAAPSCGSLSKK
jgi:hypothetical protein